MRTPRMKSNIGSILKTSMPIVVDLAAQILMWTIEVSLVARIGAAALERSYPGLGAAGVDALTAVGSIVQIILWTFTVLLIFIFGATITINKLVGEGKRGEADHFLGQALFTATVPAVGIAVVWHVLAPFIFETVLGTTAAVTAIGVDYLRTLSPLAPFVIMNFVAIGIVRGAGDTHLSMITSLLVNGIHLVLAVLLIFGISVFPALGVRGSAIAAGAGHTIGCLFTFIVILRGRSVLTFTWRDFTSIRRESIIKVLRTGTPITLEQLAWMSGTLVVIGYSNRLGAIAASSHMIILTYQRLLSVLYQAFAMAALTLVGQSYGASLHQHAGQTTRQFFWIVGGIVLCIAFVIFSQARHFVTHFTSDPGVLAACTGVLKLAAFVQVPKALSFVYSYSLRGVGENRYPMYLAIAGVLIFEVALGYSLAYPVGLALSGLWIAAGLDEIFKVLLSVKRFHRRIVQLTA